MKLGIAVFAVVLASSISTTIVATEMYIIEGCVTSDNCPRGLTCESGLHCTHCVLPGTTLALSYRYKECRKELGQPCEQHIQCKRNHRCAQKVGNDIKTCQCMEWMKEQKNRCVEKTFFDIHIEMRNKLFSGPEIFDVTAACPDCVYGK